jgi:hypothetical protein
MDRKPPKSVAQLRALAGAWREQADNATSASLAEQMLRTAKGFDEKASALASELKSRESGT